MGAEHEEWESYPCRVDDEPASILLNLAYREQRPPGHDTLYFAGLEILEPGDHGMGLEPDVKELWRLEDLISAAATTNGFTYVGRVRSQGDWQLAFYAVSGKDDELESLVVEALGEADRGYRIDSNPDAEWGYFHDFLMPDAERWQWIMNRRVVTNLEKSGDVHTIPRPVDHFIDFQDRSRRDAFLSAARERGFTAEAGTQEEGDDRHTAQLVRADPVTLGHIHEVVMDIIELAEAHAGDYNGWGAPVANEPN